MPYIKITYNDAFNAVCGLDTSKAYGLHGVPRIVVKNCASVFELCPVKLFRFCQSKSTLPPC